ncbi:MAG: hypothetical protein NPIRA03_06950 [Nitrospirales bacterium]|nr:MAG: hypothetical protein NPIRA03_06950 [Nitrospirales bacterium]
MYILLATLDVLSQHFDEFVAAMLKDAKNSVEKEDDCLRLDVLRNDLIPNRIYKKLLLDTSQLAGRRKGASPRSGLNLVSIDACVSNEPEALFTISSNMWCGCLNIVGWFWVSEWRVG